MITEDYVSFEVAKLLKEKGFNDVPVYTYYLSYGGFYLSPMTVTNKDLYAQGHIAAPTHQMAMKWLREEKNILIYVYPVIDLSVKNDDTFYWQWDGKKKTYSASHIGDKYNYESFEEAVEAALKYSLKNLI